LSQSSELDPKTSKYKFFQNKNNSKKLLHLYDLEKDPDEEYNIADSNPTLVNELDDYLIELRKDVFPHVDDNVDENEIKKIQKELKKLGYM